MSKGLNFALEELKTTGWSDLDSTGCTYDADGRAYPTVARVRQEFSAAGFDLTVRHADAFGVYRAEWTSAGGESEGSAVGLSEDEAAVFALAKLRRSLVSA